MSGPMPNEAELSRMETAADWLRRLHAAPDDETLAGEWFDWCQAQPENLQAFERMQAVWQVFDAHGLQEDARLTPFHSFSRLRRTTAGMQEVGQRMERLPTTAGMQEVGQRMERLPTT